MTENRSITTQLENFAASIVPSLATSADIERPLVLDTSHWTGPVNWEKAEENGIDGAIIKFTDGVTISKYAEINYRGATDRKLPVGGYHWMYRTANISTGRQARFYLDFLKDHPCQIRPSVDFEWTKYLGVQSNPNKDDLYGFVIPFEDGYQKKPMIYTAPGYWLDPKNKSNPADKTKIIPESFWAAYMLWLAQYRVITPSSLPPWYDNYYLHQFTGNGDGVKYGQNPLISKSADLSYFNGTRVQFLASLDNFVPPVEPPPTPMTIEEQLTDLDERVERIEGFLNL